MIGAEFSPVNENKKSWFCISKIEFHDTKQYVPKEFSHIFSATGQMHQAEKIKNRRKNEVVRPFEPSSTVVHPCTTVEGEFCACTKLDKNRQVIIKTVFITITKKSIPSL